MKTVVVNPFCRRHVAESPYSHLDVFDEDWEKILQELAEILLGFGTPRNGTRPGVSYLEVPVEDGYVLLGGFTMFRFYSGVIPLKPGIQLHTTFGPRQPGEVSFKQTVAFADKLPATAVDLVLYEHEHLSPTEQAGLKADYHIASINARVSASPEPETPEAMMRNDSARLGLAAGIGGTPAEYTADQYRESIAYWSQHAMKG